MKMSYFKISNFKSLCNIMVICGALGAGNNANCEQYTNGAQSESEKIRFTHPDPNDHPLVEDNTNENWSIHGQASYLFQQNDHFFSQYHSQNSLLNQNEGGGDKSYTFSATSFLGGRLWRGAEFYFNPEIFQGIPFNGQLVGLGGFQNGELQKGAFTSPVYYTARAFLRQTINLGGEEEFSVGGPNQIKGLVSTNRLVLSFGKLATLDYFDDNAYSHDPRTQFQNFALFSMGAYGYAADIKGFTYGGVAEWYQDDWIVKIARLALPTVPNTPQLDFSLSKDYADQIELTRFHHIAEQPGALRILWYRQNAFMASYQDAINARLNNSQAPEITENRKFGTTSWGYGLNLEQALNPMVGFFARWSWNPGNTETQTLDISQSLSGGFSIKGGNWSRPKDTVGVGYAIDRISGSEINYLKQGGMTAFIGDGNIDYKPETIFECNYNAELTNKTNLTIDYQKVTNPAYNSARGPIHILGLRLHFDF
jgi:high affinity Mn2+ porin